MPRGDLGPHPAGKTTASGPGTVMYSPHRAAYAGCLRQVKSFTFNMI